MEKLTREQINELEDEILVQLPDLLPFVLETANENGMLSELMDMLYLDHLLPNSFIAEALPTGKIIVFGDSAVKPDVLLGIAKSLGLEKDRLEFYDYEKAKTFQSSKLEYRSEYSAILIGPVPHKAKGTEGYSSLLTSLEDKHRENIIPAHVVRLGAGEEMKITKTNFKEALIDLIDAGVVKVG